MVLGSHAIPAFYLGGRWYLEKCAAFCALGKVHVTRCSSYRSVDRILTGRGLCPLEHFLADFDRAWGEGVGGGNSDVGDGDKAVMNRTRRNHIRCVTDGTTVSTIIINFFV